MTARSELALYALGRGDFLAAVTGNPRSMSAAAGIVDERLATRAPADAERARLSVP